VTGFLAAAQKNAMCGRAATQIGWLKGSKLNETRLWNGEGGASYLTTGGGGYLHQFGGTYISEHFCVNQKCRIAPLAVSIKLRDVRWGQAH